MNTKDYIILFLILLTAGTIANLLSLKIAGDQVAKQLEESGALKNPLLKLLTK